MTPMTPQDSVSKLVELAERLEDRAIALATHYLRNDEEKRLGGTGWIEEAANCITVASALRSHQSEKEQGR